MIDVEIRNKNFRLFTKVTEKQMYIQIHKTMQRYDFFCDRKKDIALIAPKLNIWFLNITMYMTNVKVIMLKKRES